MLKKLKFSPVVAIQGARQTGKSFMVRELLPVSLRNADYVSLDQLAKREFAQNNPESFLAQHAQSRPLIIDEAQRAPNLFEAIKFAVDQNRKPGRYIILGSTEFSKLTRVRESLTGRMSRLRLYPLNLAEVLGLNPKPIARGFLMSPKPRATRADLMRHLERGGMPALFAVRSAQEYAIVAQDWLELTTRRDVMEFKTVKIEGDLCYQILVQAARLDEPTLGHMAKVLRRDPRRIKTHLDVLCTLFVLNVLPPHALGTGRPFYFLCDVGLAKHLGASFERQLVTWILNEHLSQYSYADHHETQLYYYRAPKGGLIHFILDTGGRLQAIKVIAREGLDKREVEILKAFRKKAGPSVSGLWALGSDHFKEVAEGLTVFPWESVV